MTTTIKIGARISAQLLVALADVAHNAGDAEACKAIKAKALPLGVALESLTLIQQVDSTLMVLFKLFQRLENAEPTGHAGADKLTQQAMAALAEFDGSPLFALAAVLRDCVGGPGPTGADYLAADAYAKSGPAAQAMADAAIRAAQAAGRA